MINIWYYYYDNMYQVIFNEYDLYKAKRFIAMCMTKRGYAFDSYSCDSNEVNEVLSGYVTALRKKIIGGYKK